MTTSASKDFLAQFKFKRRMEGYVGIERERFLVTPAGILVPRASEFLDLVRDPRWTYELSACQVEDRTRPQKDASAVKLELLENDNVGRTVAEKLGLRLANQEVASKDMPLDVYPDPRYRAIVASLSREKLLAACRVTGTHLHIGVRNMKQALAINNALVAHLGELCRLGDHSGGERLRIYKIMAEHWQPMVYRDARHFFDVAQSQSFADSPRNCWHLIRISIHGTVELRMFGVTDSIDEILEWISYVRSIIKTAEV